MRDWPLQAKRQTGRAAKGVSVRRMNVGGGKVTEKPSTERGGRHRDERREGKRSGDSLEGGGELKVTPQLYILRASKDQSTKGGHQRRGRGTKEGERSF